LQRSAVMVFGSPVFYYGYQAYGCLVVPMASMVTIVTNFPIVTIVGIACLVVLMASVVITYGYRGY
jgi:hypothetical protein